MVSVLASRKAQAAPALSLGCGTVPAAAPQNVAMSVANAATSPMNAVVGATDGDRAAGPDRGKQLWPCTLLF